MIEQSVKISFVKGFAAPRYNQLGLAAKTEIVKDKRAQKDSAPTAEPGPAPPAPTPVPTPVPFERENPEVKEPLPDGVRTDAASSTSGMNVLKGDFSQDLVRIAEVDYGIYFNLRETLETNAIPGLYYKTLDPFRPLLTTDLAGIGRAMINILGTDFRLLVSKCFAIAGLAAAYMPLYAAYAAVGLGDYRVTALNRGAPNYIFARQTWLFPWDYWWRSSMSETEDGDVAGALAVDRPHLLIQSILDAALNEEPYYKATPCGTPSWELIGINAEQEATMCRQLNIDRPTHSLDRLSSVSQASTIIASLLDNLGQTGSEEWMKYQHLLTMIDVKRFAKLVGTLQYALDGSNWSDSTRLLAGERRRYSNTLLDAELFTLKIDEFGPYQIATVANAAGGVQVNRAFEHPVYSYVLPALKYATERANALI